MAQLFPIPNRDYKVRCRCFTYNQKDYIEDTLKGFAMQITNFSFVCNIVDDCSSDGEQEIIMDFLYRECDMGNGDFYEDDTTRLYYAQHRTNSNCYLAVYLLKENLYKQKQKKKLYTLPWREHSEYEAICEGDDFWTDPFKLQKQVDLMDANSNLSMCFHGYKIAFSDGKEKDVFYFSQSYDRIDVETLIEKSIFPKLLTMMFRIESFGKGYTEWCKKSPVGDFPMCLHLYMKGDVAYINDVMSTYRLNAANSWTSNINRSLKNRYKHRQGLNKVWRQFDAMSEYKYTKLVNREIRKRNLIFLANIIKLFLNKITFGLMMKIEPAIRRFFKI